MTCAITATIQKDEPGYPPRGRAHLLVNGIAGSGRRRCSCSASRTVLPAAREPRSQRGVLITPNPVFERIEGVLPDLGSAIRMPHVG
ncbi:MAG: hypothetical protein ACLSVD_03855 [Eggerthellaceae bacterium]